MLRTMKVLSATVILYSNRADKVLLKLDVPNPAWPYEDSACVSLDAARGKGIEWVRDHFGIMPLIVEEDT